MKPSSLQPAIAAYFDQHRDSLVEEYLTFLRFASISSDPAYRGECAACADWLQQRMLALGLTVERWQTEHNPILFGSWLGAGPQRPTLLLYSHYDVQPVDPLELWSHPPFEPFIDELGTVYARGAQDNKGQCFYTLVALRSLFEHGLHPPVNIKWVIEGDEEHGSAGFSALLEERRAELACDYIAIVDAGLAQRGRASLTLGCRGLVTMDVELRANGGDLHSGSFGGLAVNANHAMVTLLSSLRDGAGRVTVKGFYEQVAPVEEALRRQLMLDFDLDQYVATTGGQPLGGELALSPWERAWLRPTLEINGLSGGYSGPGFKTVLPAVAKAKISCRLVPDQDPLQVAELVRRHLLDHAPDGATVQVTVHPGYGRAVRCRAGTPFVQAFADALAALYGGPCRYTLEGGSIPITASLSAATGADALFMGMGLPDDNIHAPDERFDLQRLKEGSLFIAQAILNLR